LARASETSIETAAVIERAQAETDPAARAQFFDELGLKHADVRPGVGLHDFLWRRAWRTLSQPCKLRAGSLAHLGRS
jgi:hypothetical protein